MRIDPEHSEVLPNAPMSGSRVRSTEATAPLAG